MDPKTRALRLVAIIAGLLVFFGLVKLFGPEVHALETVAAVLVAMVVGGAVHHLISRAGR